MKGICKICGCTENNACTHPDFGSCFWLNQDQDLCSHCVELKDDPRVSRPPIMALSWRQPYASLMLPPFNKIETRTWWPTKYRGPVLICASQKAYPWNVVRDISGPDEFDRILSLQMQKELILTGTDGHAIALGILVDCRPMKKEDEGRCFVRYFPDLWCHIYENVRPIKPFPWKGSQGWKILDANYTKKIEVI